MRWITAEGKWRLTPEAFFGMPVLPERVIVRYDDKCPLDARIPIVELTSEQGDGSIKAPRLAEGLYKWKCNFDWLPSWHACRGRWLILWRYAVTWKEERCMARVYLPIIRIRAAPSPGLAAYVAAVRDYAMDADTAFVKGKRPDRWTDAPPTKINKEPMWSEADAAGSAAAAAGGTVTKH
jgi:hypothetical protein